jgi:hypothetical protein
MGGAPPPLSAAYKWYFLLIFQGLIVAIQWHSSGREKAGARPRHAMLAE